MGAVRFRRAAGRSLLRGLGRDAGDAATLGRWVGVLLLALLVGYLWISVRWSRAHPHGEPFQMEEPGGARRKAARPLGLLIAFCLIGLLLVIVASRGSWCWPAANWPRCTGTCRRW